MFEQYQDLSSLASTPTRRRRAGERLRDPGNRPGIPETLRGLASATAWMLAAALIAFVAVSLLLGSLAGQVAGWAGLVAGFLLGTARSRQAGTLKRSHR
jgi:hypothetical protein